MAPASSDADMVADQLKQIIHNLYSLMIQSYDYHGPTTEAAMTTEIQRLITNLRTFSLTSRRLPIAVPREIIEYISDARNPDIYTREFVEVIEKMNQKLKGKSEAFGMFRDALAREMKGALPELREEVEGCVRRTGGVV